MEKMDFKKKYKDLYLPKTEPVEILVPEMTFIMVDGHGNPNDTDGEYYQAVELLYALSYTIKMSKMGGNQPEGYFEYVVPPLEGFWWLFNDTEYDLTKKNKLVWTSVIRQPEFVTKEVFDYACNEVQRKKGIDTKRARLAAFAEGLCVQCMHAGAFDDEPETVSKIERYIVQNKLKNDIGSIRHHHEIYLSDPRKTEPSKMKTVLRIPVKRI